MTLSTKALFEAAKTYTPRCRMRVGEKARNTLKFLAHHHDETPNFFAQAVDDKRLNTHPLCMYTRALNHRIWEQVDSAEQPELAKAASAVFLEQFSKWAVLPNVCEKSKDAFRSALWQKPTREETRWVYHYTTTDSKSYGAIPREDYAVETLKVLNCLTEFYFGERLLPNIKPAQEYTALTWQDVQTAYEASSLQDLTEQLAANSTQPQKIDDSMMQQMQQMLLNDQLWRCDIPR